MAEYLLVLRQLFVKGSAALGGQAEHLFQLVPVIGHEALRISHRAASNWSISLIRFSLFHRNSSAHILSLMRAMRVRSRKESPVYSHSEVLSLAHIRLTAMAWHSWLT